jgi:MoaA/NifB/PqqE/SkfB family radical SAM enzyme
MRNHPFLINTDYCCKYYPHIDRFGVSRDGTLNTLQNVRGSRFYKRLEYFRYIPCSDVRFKEIDGYLYRAPKECCFEITKSCNQYCDICISAANESNTDLLAASRIDAIIERYRVARITITGGEPTLHPDLPNILEILSKHAEAVVLSTNGTNLDLLTRLFSRVNNLLLAVSLHGPEPIHDEFVGAPGSFAKVIKCVQSAALFGIPVQVITAICKENLKSLCGLCDIVKALKVTEHRLSLIKPEGRIRGNFVSYREVLSELKNVKIAYKISVKRRDQPFIFVNVLGKEEIKNARRY